MENILIGCTNAFNYAKLIVVLLLIVNFACLSATDFIINPNINNPPYDGSYAHPFITIQQAIDALNCENHLPIQNNNVTFKIVQGTYSENLYIFLVAGATDIYEWNFKPYSSEGEVRIAGDQNASLIVPIVQIYNIMGADISFEKIIFKPENSSIETGFYTSSLIGYNCMIGNLRFSECEFRDLQNGILITEPTDEGVHYTEPIPILNIDDFIVNNCSFNGIRFEGKGIWTFARNMRISGDNVKFIKKIHIFDNEFITDEIINPFPNYKFTNIRISNGRKSAVAYDSVFVYNNMFNNENYNVKPVAIHLYALNRLRNTFPCDNKCKAYAYENEILNNGIYSEISDLKYTHNNAYNPDYTYDQFIKFVSDPIFGLDTLWTEWNYLRSPNAYAIENAVFIDKQNSFLGTSTFLKGRGSNIYFTNSLITDYETIFDLDDCTITSQYCYYDQIINDDHIIYGDGIVTGNPLIEPDPSGFGYSLIWNESVKSPCIMTAYDEEFNQLITNPCGTTAFDKLDIGAIQYSENPAEWINYSFPTAVQRNGNRWLSFPTADRLLNEPYNLDNAYTLFDTLMILNNLVPAVSEIQWKPADYDEEFLSIYYDNSWHGEDHLVIPQQGYKFIMSPNLSNNVSITTEGIYPDISNETVYLRALKSDGELNENWIGYYGKQTLSPFDAFRNVIDNLIMIKTQDWCMVRSNYPSKTQAEWIYVFDHNNPHTISYGDMAVVKCYANGNFHWPSDGTELEPYELEEIEHFAYIEKPDYKPFYIDFEGTNLPKEVGFYIDDICMGAAKVVQDSVEIKAYLYEGLPEYPDIEFRLYYESKANEIIPTYSVMDIKTGEFNHKKLRLDEHQDYYIVRINTDDNESSPIPKMYIANYPNPFNPSTKIEYYVPEDSEISIDIYNVKGQKVYSFIKGFQDKGIHQINWNGKDSRGRVLGSGVYFASLNYAGKRVTQKMLMLK